MRHALDTALPHAHNRGGGVQQGAKPASWPPVPHGPLGPLHAERWRYPRCPCRRASHTHTPYHYNDRMLHTHATLLRQASELIDGRSLLHLGVRFALVLDEEVLRHT